MDLKTAQKISLEEFQELLEIAQKYFDAIYTGNTTLFSEIFHPTARLYCFTDSIPVTIGVDEYLAIVRGRESPHSKGDPREDQILSIDVPTPTTAHMRLSEIFLPKRFIDELTLVKTEAGWRIVAKVWHFTLEKKD